MGGGRIVPDWMATDIANMGAWPGPYRRERSWEERLAWEIERRSIRFRLRVFRHDWSDRITVAWDALSGRHTCEGND